MAVVSDPPWLKRTAGVSARNGTTTHAINLGWTPTAGSFLVMVVAGAVTHTNGSWTERVTAVDRGDISVFTKTSDGSETTFADTTNGSNYPVLWIAYEFPTGTTWTGSVSANPLADTWQQITGLPGTEQVVFGTMGRVNAVGETSNSVSAVWTAPWVENAEVSEGPAATDGYNMLVGHRINVTTTTSTPAASVTWNGSYFNGDRQTITWALNVATYIPPEGTDQIKVPIDVIVVP